MGKYHCIAISENFEAYSWGHGLHGQLGLNEIISEVYVFILRQPPPKYNPHRKLFNLPVDSIIALF